MASNDVEADSNRQNSCFQKWMKLQAKDLTEINETLALPEKSDTLLRQLVEKSVNHFKDYILQRKELAGEGISMFFAPPWNSSIENSLLWIAGCRPSSFIRLIYTLCGLDVESQLLQLVQGNTPGTLSDLSSLQMSMVSQLQGKTVREEDKLSAKLASLQEDMADQPMVIMAKCLGDEVCDHESNLAVTQILDEHEKAMFSVLEQADSLRITTLNQLVNILTPLQAVDFLAAGKKLHICLHRWGSQRDCSRETK